MKYVQHWRVWVPGAYPIVYPTRDEAIAKAKEAEASFVEARAREKEFESQRLDDGRIVLNVDAPAPDDEHCYVEAITVAEGWRE